MSKSILYLDTFHMVYFYKLSDDISLSINSNKSHFGRANSVPYFRPQNIGNTYCMTSVFVFEHCPHCSVVYTYQRKFFVFRVRLIAKRR